MSILEDLICPITMDWLEDPITTPCCGRAFSRSSLQELKVANEGEITCPVCREDMGSFDIDYAPKNIAIANIVETTIAQGKHILFENAKNAENEEIKWTATLHKLHDLDDEETNVSCLEILSTLSVNKNKCLLIPVIDKSGSMSGSPMTQVNYSLKRIVQQTKDSKNLITSIVVYDDVHRVIRMDLAEQTVISAGGGTSFTNAFNGVIEVLNAHKTDNSICSATIIFLTDGDDSSIVKDKRHELVAKFKKQINETWNKPLVIHTVGFGSSHDYQFLDQLRFVGTEEGAYRFADPSENTDSLSAKINSIFDTISANVSTQIEIVSDDFELSDNELLTQSQIQTDHETISQAQAKQKKSLLGKIINNVTSKLSGMFIPPPSTESLDSNMPINIQSKKCSDVAGILCSSVGQLRAIENNPLSRCRYFINNDKFKSNFINIKLNQHIVNVPIVNINTETIGDKERDMWNEWTSIMIDQLASEMIKLTDYKDMALDGQLHGALLQQRGRSLLKQIVDDDKLGRLNTILENISQLISGHEINKQKLVDLKFEGQFKTKFASQNAPTPSLPGPPPSVKPALTMTSNINLDSGSYNNYVLYPYRLVKRFKGGSECHKNVVQESLDNCSISDEYVHYVDDNGNNCLSLAASIGRFRLVEKILSFDSTTVNRTNKFNETALDLAAVHGYWKTYQVLVSYGAKHNLNSDMLLYTCLSKTYLNVATELVSHRFAKVTQKLLTISPNRSSFDWLMDKQAESISPEEKFKLAVEKGIYKTVVELIDTIPNLKYSFANTYDIFEKSSLDYVRIVDLLFSKGIADPNEIISIGKEEPEITFPLFISCENGNMTMTKNLLKYMTKENLNRQNLKGTTCLWISACNRHLDIVIELLSNGADPNIANNKGDSPLIPACQKGNMAIVEILLKSNVNVHVYNKNRDNPVLICCRTGQAEILNMLLGRMKPSEISIILQEYAEIDGFNPLLASTELDKIECIKMLHRYGADLEYRSSLDNKIIANATALHLACHYDRMSSVKTLIELGSDINARCYHQFTPLHIAVKGNRYAIVGYLLAHGADAKLTDQNGYRADFYADKRIKTEFFTEPILEPLMSLMKEKNELLIARCCRILIEYGCSHGCYNYDNINSLDCDGTGQLPIVLALQYNNQQLIECLLAMGANINRQDLNGLTPTIWAHLTNSYNLQLTAHDFNILDKIYKYTNENVQNKMLLDASNINKPSLEIVPAVSVIEKMNLGFGNRIDKTVLENLELSKYIDYSLVGFLEKFKETTMFFDSKIHLIKTIASSNTNLTPVDILAIYLWTYSPDVYKQVYHILSTWSTSNNSKNALWETYIYSLYSGLAKLQEYNGEVYRAVDSKFDIRNLPLGKNVVWNTFSSASTDWKYTVPYITNKKGMIFIIHSKSGRYVAPYSKHQIDNEVVFLPGSKFVVENYYLADSICLGQANIRKSTFSVTEKDLEKAQDGKTCIIVELTEV